LITVGNYWFGTKGWSGAEFGAVFSTWIASIIMPALIGIVPIDGLMPKLYGYYIFCGLAIFIYPSWTFSILLLYF
jgi:NHS family xanthosine MFS transporter